MQERIRRIKLCALMTLMLGGLWAGPKEGQAPFKVKSSSVRAGSAALQDVTIERRIRELKRRAVENFSRGSDRFPEAVRNLLDLISLRPYVPDYHLALALVFRKEGRWEDCYRKLNDVLDLNGPKQIVYILMAEYHMREKDKKAALKALAKAAESGMNIMEAVSHLPILKPLRRDTEFVRLALSLERFTLRSLQFPQSFRDPFTPSRLWRKVTKESKGQKEAAELVRTKIPNKEEQARLLLEARACVAALERYLSTPQVDEKKAMETYKKLQNILTQRPHITVPRIAREFDAIAEKFQQIDTRLKDLKLRYYWKQAERQIAQMRSAFENTEYPKVEETYGVVKKIAEEMVKASRSFAPAAQRLLAVADHWLERAKIREEFAKKDLKIFGIVTSKENGREANFVIINKRLLEEGDQYQGFVVEKIERNRVTVRYKGEKIGLVFRRY